MLFLSFCMPPLKYPRSIQISRLIKNMPIKPSVIYASEKNNLDFTILEDFDDYVDFKFQIPFSGGNRYISYFKRRFLSLFFKTPDINKEWSKKLYKKASEYIIKNNEDTIVTFGQPMSVHLAGLQLKKDNSNLKWIAHFSDPWVDNPLDNKGFLVKRINAILENDVFKYADKIVFTSKETIELVSNRYKKNIKSKMQYLPHCYDKQLYNYNIKYKNDKFVIRYIGGFYSQRSPKPLFEAISKIKDTNPEMLSNVIFEIIGNMGRHESLLNNYSKIMKYFNFIENVSYERSLELMLTSDVLLIIDAPSLKSVFFPSKLVDYIGSKKPIIAITPQGTSESIIRELDGLIANPDNIDDIVIMLTNVLEKQDSYKNFVPNDNYKKYNASIVTKKFMSLINNV